MSDYMAMKADQQIEAGLNERDELLARIAELEVQNAELKAGLVMFTDWQPKGEIAQMYTDTNQVVFNMSTIEKARTVLASVAKKESGE